MVSHFLLRLSVVSSQESAKLETSCPFQYFPVTKHCTFHRVVQDESHLMRKSSSANRVKANKVVSVRRWGVTATPATSSVVDLISQLEFVNGKPITTSEQDRHQGPGPVPTRKHALSLESTIRGFVEAQSASPFHTLADVLQTFMVRHTKAQRIGGAEALALPPSTTSTVLLNMSPDEDRAFNHFNCSDVTFQKHLREGVSCLLTSLYHHLWIALI